ncbi:hypothetical protein C8F01DRAFT_266211 [Mycena amicta]|nr:hypothetical protein C8F01DRAFT_266211 [Mycena amicta]
MSRAFLIEESPHVASYITSIHIPVVDSSYPTLVRECIVQILDCLTSVQRCAISPRPRGEFLELGLEPSYEKCLVAFLQRQPLRKLHVERIRHMSVNAAIHLVRCAPMVSFFAVSLLEEEEVHAAPVTMHNGHHYPLRRLELQAGSSDICHLLARDSEDVYGLHRLDVAVDSSSFEPSHKIIMNNASSLRHLGMMFMSPLL